MQQKQNFQRRSTLGKFKSVHLGSFLACAAVSEATTKVDFCEASTLDSEASFVEINRIHLKEPDLQHLRYLSITRIFAATSNLFETLANKVMIVSAVS
jgi:hypothetical protein